MAPVVPSTVPVVPRVILHSVSVLPTVSMVPKLGS